MNRVNAEQPVQMGGLPPYLMAPANPALVFFLYQLLRDEIPGGVVERLAVEAETATADPDAISSFSNPFTAQYALNLAVRLTGGTVEPPEETL